MTNQEFIAALSKMFLDIMKYIITGIILATFVGTFDFDTTQVYVVGALMAIIAFCVAAMLAMLGRKKSKKKHNKRR